MGKRTIDVGELAALAPLDARLPSLAGTPPRLRRVPVGSVAVNPVNPRPATGDLSDLESMKDGQLQPCVVVTRAAFVAIHPEHEAPLGGAEYVVLAGSRRRAAAEKFEVPTLDVMVRDDLATDRVTFTLKALTENVDRLDLNPMEEAHAVERLVGLLGTGDQAAATLHKSKGWVSQRRRLLNLSPAMQAHLLAGDLKIAAARELAKLPTDRQETVWLEQLAAQIASGGVYPVNPDEETTGAVAVAPDEPERPIGGAVTRPQQLRLAIDLPMSDMARTLREHLTHDQAQELGRALLEDKDPA